MSISKGVNRVHLGGMVSSWICGQQNIVIF